MQHEQAHIQGRFLFIVNTFLLFFHRLWMEDKIIKPASIVFNHLTVTCKNVRSVTAGRLSQWIFGRSGVETCIKAQCFSPASPSNHPFNQLVSSMHSLFVGNTESSENTNYHGEHVPAEESSPRQRKIKVDVNGDAFRNLERLLNFVS